MTFRALNEEGNALFEGRVRISESWASWGKLINNSSPPITNFPTFPLNTSDYAAKYTATVAIEVLSIQGGYVFYNTGADGDALRAGTTPYFPTGYPPGEDHDMYRTENSTMLMPGDILGPASYIRPMQRTMVDSPYAVRQVYRNTLDFNTTATYEAPATATMNLLVPHGRMSRLFAELKITRASGSTAELKVNYFYRYRMVEIAYNTNYRNSARKTAWSPDIFIAQNTIASGGSAGGNSTVTTVIDSPSPGKYECQLIATRVSSASGSPFATGTEDNYLYLLHEIWP